MSEGDWSTLPYDPMRQLADNLWVVDGDLKNMPMRRRMLVVRLQDGGLLIHNGVAMNEADMAQLEALGQPQYLVVPSRYHRIDAARFKARYPDLVVLAPAGALAAIAKKVPVDATYDALPSALTADPTVEIVHLAGSKEREGALLVHSADGLTLVLNDAMFNMQHQSGLFWFVYGKLMRNAGGPKVTSSARWVIIKDKKAYRAQLEGFAERGVKRIAMAHGDLIEDGGADVLRQVATTL